jgi:hypothetical protein
MFATESRRRLVFLIIAVACVGAFVWIAFELGQIRAGHNSFEAAQEIGALEALLEEERVESQTLSQRIAQLEMNRKIDEEAYRQVENELSGLQQEILSQQEDLEFYRGIVADQQVGLRVQDLVVWAGTSPLSYSMRLVLAQAIRANRLIAGTVELAVEGIREGQPVTLGLSELTGAGAGRLDFSFRYFQNLDAELVLPEGFVPARVNVKLKPKGAKAKAVEKVFDWEIQTG